MKYLLIAIALVVSPVCKAGKIADFVGAYLANDKGECKTSTIYGKNYPDSNISGVCISMTAMFDEKKKELVTLAVTELKNPEQLEAMIQLELAKRQPTEAYEVQIKKKSDDIFKLIDGSILEKTGYGYVGYVGYHEESILYKDGEQWKFCVNGSSFKVDVLKYVEYHYSKDSISGKSVKEIESMDVCN
ncbi:hypothetical protein EHW61_12835 [Salinivibrio sp. VYel6]|uniref:hypothetical protein n=1 Tax=Salinivibrio sp. VYel6 TaxID=2490493 RepID=UPI00128D81C8|nr:hypothetical protein [Salinivibrio sp. VYel6]MPX97534.1 hypothetical protein [Salinivibrio sp. VYel6]